MSVNIVIAKIQALASQEPLSAINVPFFGSLLFSAPILNKPNINKDKIGRDKIKVFIFLLPPLLNVNNILVGRIFR